MFCPKCGEENDNTAIYCKKCGTALVHNQSVSQNNSWDSAKKTGYNFITKKLIKLKQVVTIINWKKTSKKTKILSIIAFVLAITLIAFYKIVLTVTAPENIARGYFKAKTEGNWGKMFSYCALNESKLINEGNFVEIMKNNEKTNVINFEISESTDSGMTKMYTVTYLEAGNSLEQTEVITLIKNSQKKWFLFDDYKVNVEDLTITNYQIRVPKSSSVEIDNIKLEQLSEFSKEERDDITGVLTNKLYDTYIIPEIFSGTHNLSINHTDFEPFTEQLQMNEEGYEFSCSNLKPKDSIRLNLAKKTEELYEQMIASALAGDDFDKSNFPLADSNTLEDNVKEPYNQLLACMKNKDGSGYKNIKVTKFTDNSEEAADITYTCQMKIEYDYVITNGMGKSQEKLSAEALISFEYVLENGKWVLFRLNDLGIFENSASKTLNLEAAYQAYHKVLSDAVNEYGIAVELSGDFSHSNGIQYAELVDFDENGIPELLFVNFCRIDNVISTWDYYVYGYSGEAELYFEEHIESGYRGGFTIATTTSGKKYLHQYNQYLYGGENHYYTVENGEWVKAMECSADEVGNGEPSYHVNGELVDENDYKDAKAEMDIVGEQSDDTIWAPTSDEKELPLDEFDAVQVVLRELSGKSEDEEFEKALADEASLDNASSNKDYILPFSSTRTLTEDDLRGLSKKKLRIARNEIYARYGRQFNDKTLQKYFNKKDWYAKLEKLPVGKEPTLTKLEILNADLIQTYEER